MSPAPNAAALDAVSCYRARTDRLGALSQFLACMAPAIGETRESCAAAADEDLSAGCHGARESAVRAAFEAVSRIAREA